MSDEGKTDADQCREAMKLLGISGDLARKRMLALILASCIEGAEAMLDAVAKHECAGCREGWTIEVMDDEPMHLIPPDKREAWEPYAHGTHLPCECPTLDPRIVVENMR